MRTVDVVDLEEFLFDDSLDALTSKELADALAYDDDGEDRQELGYRALLERPEALSPSLRPHLH